MFAGSQISNADIRLLRKVGMGFLLAGVFAPCNLLAFLLALMAGVYVSVRMAGSLWRWWCGRDLRA